MAVRQGSITAAQREFVETWENIATYQNGIVRLDVRGDERQEMVQGKREFYITTEERLLTQAKVLKDKDDPFKNGAFRPVVVPEDVTIETNPNALSDEEILGIFTASDFAWDEWMRTIDSPATLNRMVDLADSADGVTVKRLRSVQMRLREVRPQTRLMSNRDGEPDATLQGFLDAAAGGSPRNAPQRGMGGRSSDYR